MSERFDLHCLGCYNRAATLGEGELCDCGCHTAERCHHNNMNGNRMIRSNCVACKDEELDSLREKVKKMTEELERLKQKPFAQGHRPDCICEICQTKRIGGNEC